MINHYIVELLPKAVKEYTGVPAGDRQRLKIAILGLEKNPRGSQIKKLVNREYYRLRVGGWRVIFALSDNLKRVTVISVERRTSTTY
jgi:mRNA interferase RelE/StbE